MEAPFELIEEVVANEVVLEEDHGATLSFDHFVVRSSKVLV